MQQIIVALIVIVAAVAAAWQLLGARPKLWLLGRLSRVARGSPAISGFLDRQRQALARSGCAGCSRNTH